MRTLPAWNLWLAGPLLDDFPDVMQLGWPWRSTRADGVR